MKNYPCVLTFFEIILFPPFITLVNSTITKRLVHLCNSQKMEVSVDDVWASMKDSETDRISELRKRTTALKSKSNVSVVDLIKKADAKAKKITASHAPPQLLDDSTAAILGIDNRKKTTTATSSSTKKKAITVTTTQNMELEGQFADQLTVSDEKKASNEANDSTSVPSVMKASEMLPKIARDLNLANSEDVLCNVYTKSCSKIVTCPPVTTTKYSESLANRFSNDSTILPRNVVNLH